MNILSEVKIYREKKKDIAAREVELYGNEIKKLQFENLSLGTCELLSTGEVIAGSNKEENETIQNYAKEVVKTKYISDAMTQDEIKAGIAKGYLTVNAPEYLAERIYKRAENI